MGLNRGRYLVSLIHFQEQGLVNYINNFFSSKKKKKKKKNLGNTSHTPPITGHNRWSRRAGGVYEWMEIPIQRLFKGPMSLGPTDA